MRAPVSWLREFVEIPDDVSFEELHAAFVRVGFEEEAVHRIEITGPVVVGRVLSAEPEPQSNGKTINWCRVDVGEPEPRGIVCGAHNFEVGDLVVVSLPGAVLPGPFPIAARTTYGHVSDGMIASARELGLGEEHAGILRLTELDIDAPVGSDAIALLGLADFAVEVNVTPDRGYALSMRGLAREYSHATGARFVDPVGAAPEGAPGDFPVHIDDRRPIRGRRGADVFVTRVVRNVDATRPTPPWMTARLGLAGIRSVSLVVDITNYVMLELGQPIHAYDLDRLAGGLVVRRAAAGESLVTLDGKSRALHTEDLVIADDSGPIGVAGVMGGASTEIGIASSAVLIEAARFDPVSVARTARRHRLGSEASRRFERGVDPRVAPVAAERVVQLLEQLASGVRGESGSHWDESVAPGAIELPRGFVGDLIGVEYTDREIGDSLTAIGAELSVDADGALTVMPPTWRPDLTDAPSLAEEVARVVGYDRIPATVPIAPSGRGLTRSQRLRRLVANALAASGSTEVLSYPFVSASANALFSDADRAVSLANPLDPEASWMRMSLLPGLLAVAHRNLARGLADLRLFELGSVVLNDQGRAIGSGVVPPGAARPEPGVLDALTQSIPHQPWHVGALFLGAAIARQPDQESVPAGVSDALDAARLIAAAVRAPLTVRQASHPAFHPGRAAELLVGDAVIGHAGELLPAVAMEHDLPRVVAVLELDLDALIAAATTEVIATAISAMPAATQDVSLVVERSVPAGLVRDILRDGAGPLLESVALVDDYRGAGLPSDSKSLTFALRFRAPDRTLTAAEASAARTAAADLAKVRIGATLRE